VDAKEGVGADLGRALRTGCAHGREYRGGLRIWQWPAGPPAAGLCLPPPGGYSRRRMSTLEIRTVGAEKAQDCGLLAPDEPRPFDLVNSGGKAPLLLLCDHATRFIPRALGRLGLDE